MNQIKVTRPAKAELEKLNVESWSPWGCEESTFDWQYSDEETCYIKEGFVTVETESGEKVDIQQGDLVTFPKGLKCTWHVKKSISKLYTFN